MRHFSKIDLGWSLGSFGGIFNEAKEIANILDVKVSFEFNGVTVNISKNSTLDYTCDKTQEAIQSLRMAAYGEGY